MKKIIIGLLILIILFISGCEGIKQLYTLHEGTYPINPMSGMWFPLGNSDKITWTVNSDKPIKVMLVDAGDCSRYINGQSISIYPDCSSRMEIYQLSRTCRPPNYTELCVVYPSSATRLLQLDLEAARVYVKIVSI